MRLISCRTDSGEALGVMAGERWIAAVELVPDGPATMADLLNDGAAAMTRVREAAVPERILSEGGVGVFRDPPRFLGAGDTVAVEIERIGRLENRCVFETAGGPA